jgi:hypothetical protein
LAPSGVCPPRPAAGRPPGDRVSRGLPRSPPESPPTPSARTPPPQTHTPPSTPAARPQSPTSTDPPNMPRPPVQHIEPHRKRLLHPLHNLRQQQPVIRPNEKRNLGPAKPQPAQLEPVNLPRLIEHLPKQVSVRLRPKQRLSVVHRRANKIPCIGGQNS